MTEQGSRMSTATSRLSHESAMLIGEIAKEIMTNKLLRVAAGDLEFDTETLSMCWEVLGSYIARVMRSGKGVHVHKLGTFTFTSPQLDLTGVTNPDKREHQTRFPIFLPSKDFAQNQCKACVPVGKHLRPLPLQLAAGTVPVQNVSFVELSVSAQLSKQKVQMALERIILTLSEKARNNENFSVELPHTGLIMVRHKLMAIQYEDQLAEDVREAVRKMGFAFSRDMSPGPKKTLTRRALEQHASNPYMNQTFDLIENGGTKFKVRPSTRHSSFSRETGHKRNVNSIVFTLIAPGTTQAEKALALDQQFLQQLADQRPRLKLLLQAKDSKKEKELPKKTVVESIQLLGLQLSRTHSLESEMHSILNLTKSTHKESVKYEELLAKLPVLQNELKELKSSITKKLNSLSVAEPRDLQVRGRPSSSLMSIRNGVLSPARSHKSQLSSGFSRLELAAFMRSILRNKRLILSHLESNNEPTSPSSSHIMPPTKLSTSNCVALLKKFQGLESLNYSILKNILTELGISAHGSSVSVLLLIRRVQIYLEEKGDAPRERPTQNYALSPDYKKVIKTAQQVQEDVQSCFYREASRMQDIYQKYQRMDEGCPGLRRQTFKKMIDEVSQRHGRSFSEYEVFTLFNSISTDGKFLTLQEFEQQLKWRMPSGGWSEKEALRDVREWLQNRGFDVEIAFERLLSHRRKNLEYRLFPDDFERACRKERLDFTAPQADYLFTIIDKERKGFIVEEDFRRWVAHDVENPLQVIREIVSQHGLAPQQLLRGMRLSVWSDPLDQQDFCRAVKRLDRTLKPEQVYGLFMTLVDKTGKVSIRHLIQNFTGHPYETVDFRNEVFKKIFSSCADKQEELREAFDEVDKDHDGLITEQDFITILINHTLLARQTLVKFVPFMEFGPFGKKIKYEPFLEQMGRIALQKDYNPLQSVLKRLRYFLHHNNQTPGSLLQRLATKAGTKEVSVRHFADFLKAKIDKRRDVAQLRNLADKIDIDDDGVICNHDLVYGLENLNNQSYISRPRSKSPIPSNGFSSSFTSFARRQMDRSHPSSKSQSLSIAPQRSLHNQKVYEKTAEKILDIVKRVRTLITQKRLTMREAFDLLDTNKDGFINYGEFTQGLQGQLGLDLSEAVKRKLFAFLDKEGHELIQYEYFRMVMQELTLGRAIDRVRQILETEVKGLTHSASTFGWEYTALHKLKNWMKASKMEPQDLVKCLDHDFDGTIGKNDLRFGLVHHAKIEPEHLSSIRLDRIFRLLDTYKTGSIDGKDIARFLGNEPKRESKSLVSLLNGINRRSLVFKKAHYEASSANSSFNLQNANTMPSLKGVEVDINWKVNATHQLGLYLSKQFNGDIQRSFHEISQGREQLSVNNFRSFLDKSRALFGFNLTNEMINSLYFELDPHKKGFLTLKDWSQAFAGISWKQQRLNEIKSAIGGLFPSVREFFEYVQNMNRKHSGLFPSAKKNQTLLNRSFTVDVRVPVADCEKAILLITGGRFGKSEVSQLFGKSASPTLSYNDFSKIFEDTEFRGAPHTRTFHNTSLTTSTGFKTTLLNLSSGGNMLKLKQADLEATNQVIDKVKAISKAKSVNVIGALRFGDPTCSGRMGVAIFRNCMRKLGIGLTYKEIDLIIKTKTKVSDDGSELNYEAFLASIQPSKEEKALVERGKQRLVKLRELITTYLVTPLDAFRMFDPQNSGKLTLHDFTAMLKKVSELCKEREPSLQNYNIIRELFDLIDTKGDGVIDLDEWRRAFLEAAKTNAIASQNVRNLQEVWDQSDEFEVLTEIIGKNRNTLRKLFEDQRKKGVAYAPNRIKTEEEVQRESSTLLPYERAGAILKEFLVKERVDSVKIVSPLTPLKMSILLRCGQVGTSYIDYARLLEVYKARFRERNLAPKDK